MDRNLRKLASIQQIDEIKPHENATNLEIAKIGGWNVVVKKGQFKPKDLCVYCEIDCQMPEGKPEFEFLKDKHYRIKTIRLRGALSQGIAFHFNDLTFEYNGKTLPFMEAFDNTYGIFDKNSLIGTDVSELLGIKKYEPPIPPQLMGMAKGNFPTHIIPKTDEQRLQSSMGVLDEIKGKMCYITIKEDGTSATFYHNNDTFGVCSRNLELKNEAFPNSDMNIYWKIAKQYDIENKLKRFYEDTGRNIAIQGEICGDGINKNKLGLPRNSYQLHIFSIYDINKHSYVDYDEVVIIASILNIPTVETIYLGKFEFTLEQLLKMSEGKYSGTNNEREGIVIRPTKETFSDTLQGRLSFKVISNSFLMKEEE